MTSPTTPPSLVFPWRLWAHLSLSSTSKNSSKVKQTPDSGEALLRGQAKNLLQKIEEEGGELVKPLDRNPAPRFRFLADSAALRFLVPNPANTPLVGNLSDNAVIDEDQIEIPTSTKVCFTCFLSLVCIIAQLHGRCIYVDIKIMIVQGADIDTKQEVDTDLLVSPLTRALLFDSPGKSDILLHRSYHLS